MIQRRKVTLVILLLFTAITNIPWRRFSLPWSPTKSQHANISSSETIVIGMMTCAGGYDNTGRGFNETKVLNTTAQKPLALIKSVLISAKIWRANQLEFHIFTDSWMLTKKIETELGQYKAIMSPYLKMTVYFYNAFEAVPRGHEREFIDGPKRCGYVRIFFPNSLPETVKEILYLDSDVIITGNILQIWNNFKTKIINKDSSNKAPFKLAGMVQNTEALDKNYIGVFNYHFKNVPHVPPKGVNTGVMFMNLDAMRGFNWSDKAMEIIMKRRQALVGDQQLINILFHDYLDRLVELPCQYNFQHLHCEMGMSCKSLLSDPNGIQIMHGAGGMFDNKGRSHYQLFQAFKDFNLEDHEKVGVRLFKPLIKYYSGNATEYVITTTPPTTTTTHATTKAPLKLSTPGIGAYKIYSTTTTTKKQRFKFKTKFEQQQENRATCFGKIGKYLFKNML